MSRKVRRVPKDWVHPKDTRGYFFPLMNWEMPSGGTHLMMYETTTEGTPISPIFSTPEELAKWLADNGASACGDMSATYDQWLEVIRVGNAPTMIIENGIVKSGVEGLS